MPNESYKPKPPTLRTGVAPGATARNPGDTVPDLAYRPRAGARHDTVPEQAGVYVPPQPLAPTADHRTMEISPVRLAQEIDPRRAMTQLRLSAPPPRRSRNALFLPLLVAGALLVAFVAHRVSMATSESEAPVAIPEVPAPSPVATIPATPLSKTEPASLARAPVEPVAPPAPATTPAPPATPAERTSLATPAAPTAHASAARAEAPGASAAESGRAPGKVREPWLE